MPAYEHLADNFGHGHVVYGLDGPRKQALNALQTHGFERTSKVSKPFSCGLASKTKRNIIIQNDLTNAVWDPGSANQYATDKNIKKALVNGQTGIHFKALLSGHDKYNVASRVDLETDPVKKATNAWKRTSKAGLEFHVKNNRTVHFIMTGLNIHDIASKSGHGQSITSSELRWLYRHRHLDNVKDNVKFYNADQEMSHDEVFSDPAWGAYRPKHLYQGDWERTSRRSDSLDEGSRYKPMPTRVRLNSV